MRKMVLVALLVFVMIIPAQAENKDDLEFFDIDLYESIPKLGKYYREYCIGMGFTIEYFANQQTPEGRGVPFGRLAEFTLAADRWIKHCSPYLEYERRLIDMDLHLIFDDESKQ